MSTDTLAAIDPNANAVVDAAAGTGKTWLLVSRVIRLLLAGAAPGSILAITFTVKAAAEMRIRLEQRLFEMCAADDAELHDILGQIGIEPNDELCARARGLYEQLLITPYELRTTTFHSFCQELLQRFSFEAGVPPAFEIIENTYEMEAAAWRALDQDLFDEGNPVAAPLNRLLQDVDGPFNARRALSTFLAKRSEWWAYTEDMSNPVSESTKQLVQALNVDPAVNPADLLAQDTDVRGWISTVTTALQRHPGPLKTMLVCLQAAAKTESGDRVYELLYRALFTEQDEPRKFEIKKPMAKALGAAEVQAMVGAHGKLLNRVTAMKDGYQRFATYRRARDWYVVGVRLLEHFQRIKQDQSLLDFSDLEWLTYRLLRHGRHAEWIQYKLDRRIDHLLIDEFQDTNPTQWRLLLPLLEEMAAGASERARSVFLVGDVKQSIYRFRRADPALLHEARIWLETHTAAQRYEQYISWRSSPAVIDFVNLLFERNANGETSGNYLLPGFRAHETHRKTLWGHAELLPLVGHDVSGDANARFRNPLEAPRLIDEDLRHRREGEMVAEKIKALLGQPLFENGGARPLRYGDVLILLRDRNNAAAYEAALRHAGIPYIGAGRGNFLDCLEVRDLVHLLRLLVAPFDDVAVASVLRSPIFAASEDDLLTLAGIDGKTWIQRLTARHLGDTSNTPLARAARLLTAWRKVADSIPVHDLLDRIYFDAAVPARYHSAAPTHLKSRVAANLTRLLDLALDLDSGRFPSLGRFLDRLEQLTQHESEALGGEAGDQVRLLTIHGAKGLEAPVVFVVDTARLPKPGERAMGALIEWPIAAPRPTHFLLAPRKHEADSLTRELSDRDARAAAQEESNLLYVAVTRAKQMLFVSGCEPKNRGETAGKAGDPARGWYGHIENRLRAAESGDAKSIDVALHVISVPEAEAPYNVCGHIAYGSAPAITSVDDTDAALRLAVDPALTKPFDIAEPPIAVTPSQMPLIFDDLDPEELESPAPLSAAIQRGIVIHRMLERLTATGVDGEQARKTVWHEFAAACDEDWLAQCWAEARAVVDAPHLQRFFDPTQYQEARNEVAVLYRAGEREVTGVIDRLVIRDEGLVLIDYKTHRVDPEQIPALAARYAPQLRLYADGLRRLWPKKSVEAVLLFTASAGSVPVRV